MSTILFFGDSLTAGYGLANPAKESFPALIEQKINAASLPYEVINAGVSGDTSFSGLRRLDYWLSRPINVFVLELGINDFLRGIQPAETQKNLQQIIDRVRQKHPQASVALMGMQLPEIIPAALIQTFRQIFRTLADANRLAFVPFFLEGVAGISSLNLGDRIHPSAAGYKVIADKVWPYLKPLLTHP